MKGKGVEEPAVAFSGSGHAPGENHGGDTDAAGHGVVTGYRLYQLIRQKGPITDHTFTIEFQDPGVRAFSFTFG